MAVSADGWEPNHQVSFELVGRDADQIERDAALVAATYFPGREVEWQVDAHMSQQLPDGAVEFRAYVTLRSASRGPGGSGRDRYLAELEAEVGPPTAEDEAWADERLAPLVERREREGLESGSLAELLGSPPGIEDVDMDFDERR